MPPAGDAIDLDAERAEARERLEERRREQQLHVRAANCRRALVQRPLDGRKKIPQTLEEAALELYPDLEPVERSAIVERARAAYDGAKHVTPITTDQTRDIARAYLRDHRGATAGEVYRHVLRQGQPTISEASFATMVITPLRKELGISRSERPTGGIRKKAGGAKKRPSAPAPPATPEPDPDPDPPADPASEPDPPETALTTTAGDFEIGQVSEDAPGDPTAAEDFVDGDRILMELGGEELDAQRVEGRWLVEFEGRMDDNLMAKMMGRMISGGVGRG